MCQQRTSSDGRAATDEQRRTSRQTSDGSVMDKRRISDGQADGATGRRVTMDERETRLLYHRRLERFVEIVVNSH